jgi:hypothetical protein
MTAGMFGIIPTVLLQDKSLSDGDKVMYTILAAHVDTNRRCKHNEDYFAEFRGVDARTIRSQIKNLVNAGFVYQHKTTLGTELELATDTIFGEGKADIVTRTTKGLISYWNSVMDTEIPYTTVIERFVRRRMRNFSPEQLLRALQGRVALIKSNPWYTRPENISLSKNLQYAIETDERVQENLAQDIEDWTLVQAKVGPELVKFKQDGTTKEVLE